ncbi:UNVERIFIED_CONTAM: hypothetical protein NCL1_61257 [Trichonephila clavipes]
MALENLPKFKDICDGTFPNPVHEDVHEVEDISYCTLLKFINLPNTCSSLISCMLNGAIKLRYSKKMDIGHENGDRVDSVPLFSGKIVYQDWSAHFKNLC